VCEIADTGVEARDQTCAGQVDLSDPPVLRAITAVDLRHPLALITTCYSDIFISSLIRGGPSPHRGAAHEPPPQDPHDGACHGIRC